MSRVAAARLCPHLAGDEVDLVMHDDDCRRRQFQIAHRRAHRVTALVHIGHRFQDQRLAPSERAFRYGAVIARTKRSEAIAFRYRISRHEADIVAVPRIFFAGVAQPGDEKR